MLDEVCNWTLSSRKNQSMSTETPKTPAELSESKLTHWPFLDVSETSFIIFLGKLQLADFQMNTLKLVKLLAGVINDLFKEMTVIVTSSGGGGHLVAAKNLQETLLEEA